MSESREKLFLHWSESSQKFDYYFSGLIATVVVYLIKEHHPAPIGLNPPTIELAAIATLALSLFAGLTRIEAAVTILRITHDLAPKQEWFAKLRLRPKGQRIARASTPTIDMTESEIEIEMNNLSGVIERAEKGRNRFATRSAACYTIRNIGFMIGIVLLLIANVATPYLAGKCP